MIIKISVKKLHKMEMAWKLRLDAVHHALQKEEESNEEYRDKVASYRDKVAELSLDRECLNNKLAEADASLQRMHDRIESYKQEIEDLKREDNDVQAFQLERKEQLVTQAETIKTLTEHNDALKKQVKALDKRLIHHQTLEEQSRKAWVELHGKKIDLEDQRDAFKAHAESLDERIESYKQEIEHLRERDRTWQKDFAASNEKCKALDEQCEMLKLEVEDLKR